MKLFVYMTHAAPGTYGIFPFTGETVHFEAIPGGHLYIYREGSVIAQFTHGAWAFVSHDLMPGGADPLRELLQDAAVVEPPAKKDAAGEITGPNWSHDPWNKPREGF